MSIQERREHLVQLIYKVQDEELITLLEDELSLHTAGNNVQDTDALTPEELQELKILADDENPEHYMSSEEFSKKIAQWRSRS